MSERPTDDLELRAADERRNLRASINELKDRVQGTFDVEHQVRQHALLISAIAALTAATVGYGFAGIFSRR